MDPLEIFPYWIDSIIWWVGVVSLISWILLVLYLISAEIPEIEDSEMPTYEHEKSDDSSTCSEIYQNNKIIK